MKASDRRTIKECIRPKEGDLLTTGEGRWRLRGWLLPPALTGKGRDRHDRGGSSRIDWDQGLAPVDRGPYVYPGFDVPLRPFAKRQPYCVQTYGGPISYCRNCIWGHYLTLDRYHRHTRSHVFSSEFTTNSSAR